eukprot:m.91073 g.91073  ORF g.91073 m.91073 type:complete len:597 (-) comp51120_c0_seq1:3-1793(-)
MVEPPKFKVLFLCTGNSCRSVMAEAWARHVFGSDVQAFSAGTAPIPGQPGSVNSDAVSVLREAGLDASQARSKHIADVLSAGPFDLVVTVCDSAAEECPFLSRKHARRIIHNSFRDPPALARSLTDSEAKLDIFRSVCSEIHSFVQNVVLQELNEWRTEQSLPPVSQGQPDDAAPQEKSLSFVDRFLTVWVLLAMILGVLIGNFSENAAPTIDSWRVGTTNLPIAFGLILMMWPPLARVNYDKIFLGLSKARVCKPVQSAHSVHSPPAETPAFDETRAQSCAAACAAAELALDTSSRGVISRPISSKSGFRVVSLSLFFNWVVGPFVMFLLAIACLPDHDDYVQGLTYTGLARCIAMVIVWNTLSGGSNEYAAVLVAVNSVFQILLYSPLAYLFTAVILPSAGFTASDETVSFVLILQTVAIYMGIPFFLGIASWWLVPKLTSREWFTTKFLPFIAPLTLIALLFTIVIIFTLQGSVIVSIPLNVLRICVPVVLYFVLIFFSSLYAAYRFGLAYAESVTVAFTAASNNFELSIAVSVTVFGLASGEALACVVGALVEVPVMLALVHVARGLKRYWTVKPTPTTPTTESSPLEETSV